MKLKIVPSLVHPDGIGMKLGMAIVMAASFIKSKRSGALAFKAEWAALLILVKKTVVLLTEYAYIAKAHLDSDFSYGSIIASASSKTMRVRFFQFAIVVNSVSPTGHFGPSIAFTNIGPCPDPEGEDLPLSNVRIYLENETTVLFTAVPAGYLGDEKPSALWYQHYYYPGPYYPLPAPAMHPDFYSRPGTVTFNGVEWHGLDHVKESSITGDMVGRVSCTLENLVLMFELYMDTGLPWNLRLWSCRKQAAWVLISIERPDAASYGLMHTDFLDVIGIRWLQDNNNLIWLRYDYYTESGDVVSISDEYVNDPHQDTAFTYGHVVGTLAIDTYVGGERFTSCYGLIFLPSGVQTITLLVNALSDYNTVEAGADDWKDYGTDFGPRFRFREITFVAEEVGGEAYNSQSFQITPLGTHVSVGVLYALLDNNIVPLQQHGPRGLVTLTSYSADHRAVVTEEVPSAPNYILQSWVTTYSGYHSKLVEEVNDPRIFEMTADGQCLYISGWAQDHLGALYRNGTIWQTIAQSGVAFLKDDTQLLIHDSIGVTLHNLLVNDKYGNPKVIAASTFGMVLGIASKRDVAPPIILTEHMELTHPGEIFDATRPPYTFPAYPGDDAVLEFYPGDEGAAHRYLSFYQAFEYGPLTKDVPGLITEVDPEE